LQCEVLTRRGQRCEGVGRCQAYCLNLLKKWKSELYPEAVSIARTEDVVDAFNGEEWVSAKGLIRNALWWRTPIRGHSLEVMIQTDVLYSAQVLPDGNDHIQVQITPINKETEDLMLIWGLVSSLPNNGRSLRLPIRSETTIGTTVQAALYLLFHLIPQVDPISFDVKYIVQSGTIQGHPHLKGLRFGGV